MIRKLATALTLSTVMFIAAFGQNTQESLPNARIIKTDNGYLVYGKNKTNLKVMLYDKDLKLLSKVDQPLNKTSKSFFKVEKLSDGYLFEMNFSRLIVDSECKKVEYKEWTRDERKSGYKEIGNENMEDYLPLYTAGVVKGKENGIHLENFYIEVISKEKLQGPAGMMMGGGSSYKGPPKVRGFIPNERGVFCSHKLNWEIELEHESISDYKWYHFGQDQLYLYLVEAAKNDCQAFLYKINYKKGTVDYKYALSLEDESILAFSNLALNDEKNLIITGNYMDKDKYIKSSKKIMDGWFAIKLNPQGQAILKNTFEFDLHLPKAYKGKEFIEENMKTRCMNFRSTAFEKNGSLCLVAENIRIYYNTDIYKTAPSAGYETSTFSSYYWQTYGYTYLELDKDLQIISKEYFPELYTDSNFKKGRGYMFLTSVYNQDIFEVITEHEPMQGGKYMGVSMLNYAIHDLYSDSDQKIIVFKQLEKSEEEYSYYYLKVSGPDKGKKGLIKVADKGSTLSYFIKSSSEVIEFNSSKTGYTLKNKGI